METFRQRLDFAFKQNGITQAKFARLMDTESQNVNLWKVRGGIPRSHFIKACDILGANPSWLSEGKGHWEQSQTVKDEPNVYTQKNDYPHKTRTGKNHPAISEPPAKIQPGGIPDLSSLISTTSPRTSDLLQQIQQADQNGTLTEQDINLLETITTRLMTK